MSNQTFLAYTILGLYQDTTKTGKHDLDFFLFFCFSECILKLLSNGQTI